MIDIFTSCMVDKQSALLFGPIQFWLKVFSEHQKRFLLNDATEFDVGCPVTHGWDGDMHMPKIDLRNGS